VAVIVFYNEISFCPVTNKTPVFLPPLVHVLNMSAFNGPNAIIDKGLVVKKPHMLFWNVSINNTVMVFETPESAKQRPILLLLLLIVHTFIIYVLSVYLQSATVILVTFRKTNRQACRHKKVFLLKLYSFPL